jgi:hypothetical protein
MTIATRVAVTVVAAAATALGGTAMAHVTPPVELVPEREAVARLLGSAEQVSVEEVRLSKAERAAVAEHVDWRPDERVHRVHVGRAADGRIVSAVVVVTDYTTHGPLRAAVGLGPDGRITGASVLEVSDEAYAWVRPFVDHDFARDYVGRDARGSFALSERLERVASGSMPRYYGRVLTRLLQRAAALYDVGVLRRDRHAARGANSTG